MQTLLNITQEITTTIESYIEQHQKNFQKHFQKLSENFTLNLDSRAEDCFTNQFLANYWHIILNKEDFGKDAKVIMELEVESIETELLEVNPSKHSTNPIYNLQHGWQLRCKQKIRKELKRLIKKIDDR